MFLLACGGGEDEGPKAAASVEIPVRESARAGPGTALRDGFTVEDGSVLVGSPIPNGVVAFVREKPVVDRGWWAVLFVDASDAAEVLASYLSQAEALGYQPDEPPSGAPPHLREDVPPEDQQYTRCGTPSEGARGWHCAGAAFSAEGSPCVHFDLVRRTFDGSVESHLLMRLNTRPEACSPGTSDLVGDPDATPPPLPSEWAPLPRTGAKLGEAWGLLSRLAIEHGSAVATYRFDGLGCGDAALFEVTGDPQDVFDAYVDAIEARTPYGAPSTPRVTRVDDETELWQFWRDNAGGGNGYGADLVINENRPSMLALEACRG